MRQKSNSTPASSETLVRNIRRATRKHHAAEEKIRVVLNGLRGETSIAELCRREGIAESMYLSGSESLILLRHQQNQDLVSDGIVSGVHGRVHLQLRGIDQGCMRQKSLPGSAWCT